MLSGRPIFHPGSHSDYCVVYCNLAQRCAVQFSTLQYSPVQSRDFAIHSHGATLGSIAEDVNSLQCIGV